MAIVLKLVSIGARNLKINPILYRPYSAATIQKGLVLGVHAEGEGFELTEAAKAIDKDLDGKITALLKLGSPLKLGKTRLLWGLSDKYPVLAAAGLGARDAAYNQDEQFDERAENIRVAAGAGCKALNAEGVASMLVDDMGCARAAAEGAALSTFRYQEFRAAAKRKPVPELLPLNPGVDAEGWRLGTVGAESQNWARLLMERPSNKLTPTHMAEVVRAELTPLSVRVETRDEAWAREMKMDCFLSVAQGSRQPPVFLEMHYEPSEAKGSKPIVLVGKGVTFDTGGISLKPSAKMADMRGDMGGAAVMCATLRAAATLKLPRRIVGLVPLTENMPGGAATKPGDVFTARNGKTVLVDNTDAEGRLILADALCYAADFSPSCTIDAATLTGAMRAALGDAASGVFTLDARLLDALRRAGGVSADRVHAMPLYRRYTQRVTEYSYVDVHNVGKGSGGGACTAAAFLREFAPVGPWAHLDIAGVMCDAEDQPYVGAGMTGRPVRTLLEFLRTYED